MHMTQFYSRIYRYSSSRSLFLKTALASRKVDVKDEESLQPHGVRAATVTE